MTDLEWKDQTFADEWIARDVLADLLDLPRRIASAVVGLSGAPATVVDIGSGPGAFLARFLDDYPTAHGTWTDASEAMEPAARERLARFESRVDYRLAYLENLSAVPSGVDVITTSRASHHLSVDALYAFYASAFTYLRPGGWIVNLDHVDGDPGWDTRLRAARKQVIPPAPRSGEHPHRHDNPRPTADEHRSALTAAGFGEIAIPWKSFVTCLLMARRPV